MTNRNKTNEGVDKFRVLAGAGGAGGLIVIILFLAGIKSDIDRNCQNTAQLGTIVSGVIAVDIELSKPTNRDFQSNLIGSIRSLRCRQSTSNAFKKVQIER